MLMKLIISSHLVNLAAKQRTAVINRRNFRLSIVGVARLLIRIWMAK